MAEIGAEQADFTAQVESFLSEELAPDEEKTLDLSDKDLFKAADERLDLDDPISEPGDKEEKLTDEHLKRTYETDQTDTFLEAEIKDEGEGWFVSERKLVRFGSEALKTFREGMGE